MKLVLNTQLLASQQLLKCLILIIFHLMILVCGYKDGLYSTDEDLVVPLSGELFQQNVTKGRPGTIWVVEFYNSWCGHCIHFAPTWKSLAVAMKDWSDIVLIAAVDCSQTVNVGVCRDFNINSYPTIKIFPSSDTPNRMEKVAFIQRQKLEDIKSNIIEFATSLTPSTWPRLKPLNEIGELWQNKSSPDKQKFIIFEREKSTLGREVVLELRNTSNIVVYTMLEGNVKDNRIVEFPSLYRVKGETYSKIDMGSKVTKANSKMFIRMIREELEKIRKTSLRIDNDKAKIFNKSQQGRYSDKGIGYNQKYVLNSNSSASVVNMQDLESALHYSFRHEIAICQTLHAERLEALINFVSVLKKYFPGRQPVQNFLVKVWDMLINLEDKNLTGETWTAMLEELQTEQQYLPSILKWKSCRGSSPQFRGFPCGMWTLYHTLTVGALQQNVGPRGLKNKPTEVLLAIREYMQHFFGCAECSKHFLEMSQNVTTEITTHPGAVLWLWSRHNRVNARLHGDATEDPKFPKIQFPSEKVCPSCRLPNSTRWDERRVMKFLTRFYSNSEITIPADLQGFVQNNNKKEYRHKKQDLTNTVTDVLMNIERENNVKSEIFRKQKDIFEIENIRGPAMKNLWGLTDLDVSMCVVFYVISTLIILLLYHHFIVRRRMSPCPNGKGKVALYST